MSPSPAIRPRQPLSALFTIHFHVHALQIESVTVLKRKCNCLQHSISPPAKHPKRCFDFLMGHNIIITALVINLADKAFGGELMLTFLVTATLVEGYKEPHAPKKCQRSSIIKDIAGKLQFIKLTNGNWRFVFYIFLLISS